MYKIAISHAKHVPDFPCVEEGGVWDPVDPVYSGVGRAVTEWGSQVRRCTALPDPITYRISGCHADDSRQNDQTR